MELKVGLAQIIKHYQVSLSPKTKIPLRLKRFRFFNQIDGELWLRYKEISWIKTILGLIDFYLDTSKTALVSLIFKSILL